MLVAFRCGVALPLWAVAFGAVAFGAPQRVLPLLLTLLALGAIASTMPAIARRFGPSGRAVEVLPALRDVPPPPTNDTLDLVRMDDDGGWQMTGRRQP
jgi:hypothetical protein